MIHLFINALAASAGGGITYVRNVVRQLSARESVRATVALSPALLRQLESGLKLEFLEMEVPANAAWRFLFEQQRLPGLIRQSGANVFLSAGNFALWTSPIPQILLSRNALYTSSDFLLDLVRRREYGLWLDTKVKGALAAASIRRAEVAVAPSEAFAEDLRRWTGSNVVRIYHGFDEATFRAESAPAPTELAEKLANPGGKVRLLFVSHYNYYRNFETLFRALVIVQTLMPGKSVQVVLTCKLSSSQNPGSYRADSAAHLVESLGITKNVLELGAIPYPLLHHVYRACDIYVTPAYAESFAHPLVEAMSSGLPIVASDLAVHREICGDAALYFPRLSHEALAATIANLVGDSATMNLLRERGSRRVADFSWAHHVDELLRVAKGLIAPIQMS
jgi:glycosyltransferase involved in cell wall biosynthesis